MRAPIRHPQTFERPAPPIRLTGSTFVELQVLRGRFATADDELLEFLPRPILPVGSKEDEVLAELVIEIEAVDVPNDVAPPDRGVVGATVQVGSLPPVRITKRVTLEAIASRFDDRIADAELT